MKPIIDISFYQNPDAIDYDLLCQQIDGVIIRVGIGTNKDIHFERHYAEIHARGKPISIYHVPVTPRPDMQATMVTDAIEGKEIDFVWVDVEADYQSREGVNAYTPVIEIALGHEIGFYSSISKWDEVMQNETRWASRKFWVAAYGYAVPPLPPCWDKYALWQYTSSGRLAGYAGNLDLNRVGESAEKLFDARVTTTYPNRLKTRYTPEMSNNVRPQADWYKSGQVVSVYEQVPGWYRTAVETWASAQWLQRVENEPPLPPVIGDYAYFGGIYNQRDIRWKDHPLGTKSTIGANGCLMTCASMVCNHFGHASNPLALNNWLTANEGYLDGNLFLWAAIERLYPDMKFDGFVYNPTAQQIKAVILAGVLPIMFVDFDDSTPLIEMHWVLGIGVTGNDVIIADPWTGTMGNLSEMYPKQVIRYGSYIRR